MLDVNPDTVCRLIDLAREFHAQEQVVIPEEPGSPADDWAGNMLAAHADDATLDEFRSIIADLEPDQQQQVVALLWLGRGDYTLDEWNDVLAQAADAWNERTAEYLIAHPLLPDYLSEGLDLHGYQCDYVESAMTQPDWFRVEHRGAELAVETSGDGGALVFLHAGVADRRMWVAQTADLEGVWRTIAYDRRGFGETTCDPAATFSHIDDLAAVLRECAVGSACLIGCSQGGRIAIDFALAHPKHVDALVLVAPAISGAPQPDSHGEVIDRQLAELEAAESAGDLDRINAIEAHLWLDGPESPQDRVTGPVRLLFREMNAIALAHPPLTGEIEPPDAYSRLHELEMPVLVVWGVLDFPSVAANCRHLVEALPHARGIELDDVAHLPSLERPTRLNALLRDFLLHPI